MSAGALRRQAPSVDDSRAGRRRIGGRVVLFQLGFPTKFKDAEIIKSVSIHLLVQSSLANKGSIVIDLVNHVVMLRPTQIER